MVSGKASVVIGFALAAVIGLIFLGPIVGAVNDNTGAQTVTNESVTANTGQFVDLGGFDLVDGSETVYGLNDTSGNYEVATAGSDYEMDNLDGEVKALSGSSLIEDGEAMKVTYDYTASGSVTSTVVGFIPVMIATLLLFVISQGVIKEM